MNSLKLTLAMFSIINYGLICSLNGQERMDHGKGLPLFTGKQLIGLQVNPLFTKDYQTAGYTTSIRYGYKIAEPLTFGAEVSGYFFNNSNNNQGQSNEGNIGVGLGFIARYSSPARKRVQGFLEISPIWHHYLQDTTESIKYIGSTPAIYLAPGVSLFSHNRKISFDLYYKISSQTFTNSRHSILAYKINYHFK